MKAVVSASFARPGEGRVTDRKRSGTAERPGCASVTDRKRSGTALTLPEVPFEPRFEVWAVYVLFIALP
jgi:hypothetical protein